MVFIVHLYSSAISFFEPIFTAGRLLGHVVDIDKTSAVAMLRLGDTLGCDNSSCVNMLLLQYCIAESMVLTYPDIYYIPSVVVKSTLNKNCGPF